MNIDLDILRKQLDSVDTQIVKLLEERFLITDRVALYKDTHKIPLTDKNREQEVLDGIRDSVQHGILKEHLSEIYEKIFALNKTARRLKQQKQLPFQKIGVIGLGFMGGSIVKALKMKNQELEIFTLARKSHDTHLALKQGYISKAVASMAELVSECEIIIMASPIATVELIAKEIAVAEPTTDTIIIDIASVKEKIASTFENLYSSSLPFLATHPMAGSEKMGFAKADGMLFVDKPWIICPHKKNKPAEIEKVKQFIEYLGSKPLVLTPKKHDKQVAIVSHIVFLLSTYLFAFVSEKHPDALPLAGSGFLSQTRLASGSPAMHSQIITENYENSMISLMELLEFMKKDSLTPETLMSFFKRTKKARDNYVTDAHY